MVIEGGDLRCWGAGVSGKLGYSNTENIGDDELPSDVSTVSVGGSVFRIATGFHHTCAVLVIGELRCWGEGANGRLSYGNTENIGDDELPTDVGTVSAGGTVVYVSAGGAQTCALLDGGDVRCWGSGAFGMLGYGNMFDIGDDELPSDIGTVSVGGTVALVVAACISLAACVGCAHERCQRTTNVRSSR